MIPTLKHSLLFRHLTLFFTGWAVLALVLAWTEFFFSWIFLFYTLTFWGVAFFRHKKKIFPSSKRIALHVSLLFLLSLFLASFLQPATLFTGRDEGSLFSAASLLAETHTLRSASPEAEAFFTLYEKNLPSRLGFSGQALDFPGFVYTSNGMLTTQFPIPAIAWYASFLGLFGIMGLVLANAVLLFLFFLATTLLVKSFASPKWTLVGAGLFAVSFPLFWFSRFTLSENFLLGFLWLFVWNIVSLREKPTDRKLFSFFLLSLLVLFGRVEGCAFLAMAFAALLWKRDIRQFFGERKIMRMIIPLLLFVLAFVASLLANLPFFITVAKGFFGGVEEFSATETRLSSLAYRFSLLALYGVPLFTGIAGITLFLTRALHTKTLTVPQDTPKKTTLAPFLILWITLPAFLYLLIPFISPDHPWMLRRLAFAVVPTLILFSLFLCVFLETRRRRVASFVIVALLISSSLPALFHFFPIQQGKDLLETTHAIAQKIPNDELVLVDRLASGDGFHLLAGPLQTLFYRHAAYIIRPDDLEHLDTSAFSSVTLLVPENRVTLYEAQLKNLEAQKKETFSVSFSTLETVPASVLSFPQTKTLTQSVALYQWKTGE